MVKIMKLFLDSLQMNFEDITSKIHQNTISISKDIFGLVKIVVSIGL